VDQVKLISLTVVLTLLIWTTANQLLSDTVEVPITVVPEPAAGSDMIVRTIPPDQNRFVVTLTGPKRIVEQVRAEKTLSVAIPVPDIPENGPRSVDLKKELSAFPEQFRGLLIENVRPPRIRVMIDHPMTLTVPVFLERGDLEYEVPPMVDPAEVEVVISQLAYAEVADSQKRLTLDVGELLRDKPEGDPLKLEGVPLPLRMGGQDVQPVPETVTVRATLRQQIKTATIPAVPILIAGSVDIFNRYRIRTRDGTTLITRAIAVRGPVVAVDRLVSGGTRVTGAVVLTGDIAAQAGRWVELEPVFDLPAEVRVLGPVPAVEFALDPIAEPGRG